MSTDPTARAGQAPRAMNAATLHVVYDPLCGWCYAAAPLVEAASRLPGLRVQLHGGGMLVDERRLRLTPAWRAYVMPHDQRIAQLTGQPFGAAYTDGLLQDDTVVLDSAPPTTAILAAQALGLSGLAMLHRLQQAHFVEGQRIADREVQKRLAAEQGLAADAFDAQLDALTGAPTEAHFTQSRSLLDWLGGQGFPTLALEQAGRWTPLPVGQHLGRPEAFVATVRAALQTASGA